MIRNGFTNSIGWNLGNKNKSIHLFDPLTSMPINGTKIKKTIDIKKINEEIFISFFWSKDERAKITIVPKKINTKCLKKKE